MSSNEEGRAGQGAPERETENSNAPDNSSLPRTGTAGAPVVEVVPGVAPLPAPGTILVIRGAVDEHDGSLPALLGWCDHGVALKKLHERTWDRARRLAGEGRSVVLIEAPKYAERSQWWSAINDVTRLRWPSCNSKWWISTKVRRTATERAPWEPPRSPIGPGRAA